MDVVLIQSPFTAALWKNDFDIELRILLGDELIESRLSRYGEAPCIGCGTRSVPIWQCGVPQPGLFRNSPDIRT
jgi:hypothetical protein